MQQYDRFSWLSSRLKGSWLMTETKPINALHLELCKMDAPESKIWKLKRSACRTLSNIVKRISSISSHSTQWSDSHTRVGMLPRGEEGGGRRGRGRSKTCAHAAASTPVEAYLRLAATGSGARYEDRCLHPPRANSGSWQQQQLRCEGR